MKINLYKNVIRDSKEYFKIDWESSQIFKTIEVKDDLDIWSKALFIGGKFYTVSCQKGNNVKIVELDYFKFDEDIESLNIHGEDEITCPICGCRESDSWEHAIDNDTKICSDCGSEFEWSREVEITYSSQATKISDYREF